MTTCLRWMGVIALLLLPLNAGCGSPGSSGAADGSDGEESGEETGFVGGSSGETGEDSDAEEGGEKPEDAVSEETGGDSTDADGTESGEDSSGDSLESSEESGEVTEETGGATEETGEVSEETGEESEETGAEETGGEEEGGEEEGGEEEGGEEEGGEEEGGEEEGGTNDPPPVLTCGADSECTMSTYKALVEEEWECFCPLCPSIPATLSLHNAMQDAWKDVCGTWYATADCPDVQCEDPAEIICDNGLCVATEVEAGCSQDVSCLEMPPLCKPPYISVAKGDCWGCGLPETCTCSDGKELTCKMSEPVCPPLLELAIVDGCYECVDPISCQGKPVLPPDPPDPGDECEADEECTITQYKGLVPSIAACYCPLCPKKPVSLDDHLAFEASWMMVCGEWADEQPCPTVACNEPPAVGCDEGFCVILEVIGIPEPASCPQEVSCDSEPPKCGSVLTLTEKDGCWACAFPETCTCADGTPLMCLMPEPECDSDLELVIQKGCYACVDPITCKLPPP